MHYKITAANYDEFTGSAAVTIAKCPVTVSGITANDKTYDGKTDAELNFTGVSFAGIISGDSLSVTASGAFDSADAGDNKAVQISKLALTGDAAKNYVLAEEGQQTATTATIRPAEMTVTATPYEGVYDGTPHSPSLEAPDEAEILWSDTENGTYAAETPSFTNAGTYTAYYRVQRTNYQTVSGSVSVTITPKSVTGATVLLEQNEFIYTGDAQTAVVQMVTLPDGGILSETDYSVSANQATNVGYYLLTITGQGNYKDSATASWRIKNAGASGISAANISTTYDGNPRSILVVGVPDGASVAYSEDGENYSETNPAYTDAGPARTVYYKVTAANYDDFTSSATITIAKRPVTVSGIAVADKAYDGNASATLIYTSVTFDGIVDGDELSVTATGTFENAEVGNRKAVTITGLTLSGKDAGNYQLAASGQQATATGNITANTMGVTARGWTGTYDGETHGITVNAPAGTTVAYSESANGTFSETNPAYKNAGSYTVFYRVEQTGAETVNGSATVIINKRPVTVSGITVSDKAYDGNTSATLIYTGVTFDGIVDGDELSVTGTGTFEDAEVGNRKAVTITGLTLGGKDAGNYQLAASGQQATATGNITANTMGVTARGWTGTYDGETHGITVNAPAGATVTYSESADGTFSETNPAYKNAGTYTVFYRVEQTGAETVNSSETVTINKRPVTVSGITVSDKAYDGNTNATLIYTGVTFDGIVDGDELSVTGTGTFENAEVGNGKTVAITGLTLSGKDAGNYQLAASGQQATATGNITANTIGVTAQEWTGIYDGETHGITVNAPMGATVAYSESADGTFSETNPAYKNAGNYTVFYRVEQTGAETVNGSETVTINKRPVTVSGITVSDKAYDGNANATLIYTGVTFDGIVDGDELSVTGTGTFEDAEVGNRKAVTITGLTLGGKDAGNYQLAASGQQATATGNITANTMGVTARGWTGTYDGETHGITVNAPAGATVAYSESADEDFSETNPAYKNAGTYTVFYRVEKSGFDTVSGSAVVTISKARIIPTLSLVDRFNTDAIRNSWAYQDKASVPKLTMERVVQDASPNPVVTDYGLTVYSYKERNASEYQPFTAEDMETLPVGQYALRVEVAESKNYLSASAEANFTIVKAPHNDMETDPVTVLPNAENLSFDMGAYLEEGAVCAVSDSGGMVSGTPTINGSALQFNTGTGDGGTIRVTVSSKNYEDYAVTVRLKAGNAFTVRFDSGGGNAITETRTLRAGELFGTLPVPTRTGYTFQGWHTAKEVTVQRITKLPQLQKQIL